MAKPLERTNAARLKEASKSKAALFGDLRGAARIVDVPVANVDPNPDQPRRTFDEEALADLAASLHRHGLQQPVGVLDRGAGRFQLVYGERRLRAAARLGWELIPAMVVSAEQDAAELALVENLQRSDLTPFETADGLAALLKKHQHRHKDLGALIGKSESYVSRLLKLTALPDEIREEYAASGAKVAMTVLMEIAEAPRDIMMDLWRMVRDGASVALLRDAKKHAAGASSDTTAGPAIPPPAPPSVRPDADAKSPSHRFSESVDRMNRRLDLLIARRQTVDEAQRDRLKSLRDKIDALLG